MPLTGTFGSSSARGFGGLRSYFRLFTVEYLVVAGGRGAGRGGSGVGSGGAGGYHVYTFNGSGTITI